MIFFFLTPPPLSVLNSSKHRSEAKRKLDEQSLSPSYNPALSLTKQGREYCSLLKGRKEENVVRGAEADALGMLHLNLCVSESWRCRVTAESTNSLRASVLWERAVNPSARGKEAALAGTYTRGMLYFSCSVSPLPLVRKDFG